MGYVLVIVIGAGCLLLATIACGSADHGRRELKPADKKHLGSRK
jgi:hypothetical protein